MNAQSYTRVMVLKALYPNGVPPERYAALEQEVQTALRLLDSGVFMLRPPPAEAAPEPKPEKRPTQVPHPEEERKILDAEKGPVSASELRQAVREIAQEAVNRKARPELFAHLRPEKAKRMRKLVGYLRAHEAGPKTIAKHLGISTAQTYAYLNELKKLGVEPQAIESSAADRSGSRVLYTLR